MLIQDVEKKHPPFHEPAGKAAYLIETGKFAAVVPPEISKPVQPVQWSAQRTDRVGDYEPPPTVYFHCPNCGTKGHVSSEKGTAHQSASFGHVCGIGPHQETCPADVAATYLRLYKDWKAKSRKPAAPKLSAQSDERVIRAFGLKSRGELVEETLQACIKNPSRPPARA